MTNQQKIKIILQNGYQYIGIKQMSENGFVKILDEHDGKFRIFPTTSINVIEVLK